MGITCIVFIINRLRVFYKAITQKSNPAFKQVFIFAGRYTVSYNRLYGGKIGFLQRIRCAND